MPANRLMAPTTASMIPANRTQPFPGSTSYPAASVRGCGTGGRSVCMWWFLSVAGAGLDAMAVELVQTALHAQRLAGLRDVICERRRERVAERALHERAHDRHMLGVGWERVRGQHPPALRRELRRDVELVEVAFLGQLEGDQRKLLGPGLADQLEVAGADDPLGQRAGVGLHRLHDVA